MAVNTEAIAVPIWKTNQGYAVQVSREGVIFGKESIEEAVKAVSSRDLCGLILYKPSVLRVTLDDILKAVPEDAGVVLLEGLFRGVFLDPVQGAIMWDRGVKPSMLGE